MMDKTSQSGVDEARVGQAHVSRKTALFESRREREFYRYYEPIRSLTENGPPLCNLRDAKSARNHHPFQSPDRALTAFCQLGALRLGTRRAMLFFFDSNFAYILAEATRTLSLQDDSVYDTDDALWLGHSVIPRGYSICEETVCRMPEPEDEVAGEANRNAVHIINDLEADTKFCDKPLVTDGPKARFYAGVPIMTPKGINIGAYCCLDDRKRDGLGEKDVAFLQDIACTIMTHLEMVRARTEHQRGTRMVTGLGAFVEGEFSMRKREDEDGVRSRRRPSKPTSSPETRPPATPIPPPPTAIPHANSAKLEAEEHSTDSVATIGSISTDGESTTAAEATVKARARAARTRQQAEDLRGQLVAANVQTAFQRASTLLREALDVDGCAFLDAAVATYGGLVEAQADGDHSSDVMISSTDATETEGERHVTQGRVLSDRPCAILASSQTRSSDPLADRNSQQDHQGEAITEKFLRSLLRRYPHGKIWNFNGSGDASDDDESSESSITRPLKRRRQPSTTPSQNPNEDLRERKLMHARRRIDDGRKIQRLFPGVRSLALVGMFDQSRHRWYAACAVWTYSPLRLLSYESEFAYLSAFNDVILAEVHRLEAQNSDRAKSDFISSISHELRSPLHGILGSVECLQEQPADSFTKGLVSQVEICGRTLLDIIDHLLDFSKINHFAPRRKPLRSSGDAHTRLPSSAIDSHLGGLLSLDAEVALDEITEEVVEAAVYSFCCSRDQQTILNRKVAVLVDVVRSEDFDWRCNLPVGGWKRICINLVSNALKYTSEGHIRASLHAELIPGKRRKFNAVFSITDTGRGISREFLEDHLFRAFSQEDSLVEGTGLGMSLVSKIVKAMGGSIDVQSEKDVGTTMTVTVPVNHARRLSKSNGDIAAPKPLAGTSIGIRQVSGGLSKAQRATRALILDNAERCCEHLGATTQRLEGAATEASCDLDLIAERDIGAYVTELPSSTTSAKGRKLIVLCDSAMSARQHKNSRFAQTRTVEFIAQPCISDRLLSAIKACLDQRAETIDTDSSHVAAEPDLRESHGPLRPQPTEDTAAGASPLALPILTKPAASNNTPEFPSPNPTAQLEPGLLKLPVSTEATPQPIPEPPHSVANDFFSIRTASTHSASASPMVMEPESPRQPRPPRATPSPVPENGPSLLLVDDNHINLQLLVTYARKRGHAHTTAMNGLEAVESYKASFSPDSATAPPQVVLMDINMPLLNGFEATRAIRSFEATQGITPGAYVVALTGLGSAGARQEAFSSGVDLFLTKPVRLKELGKVLGDLKEARRGEGRTGYLGR